MTERELYNSMLQLADVFEKYKAKQINYISVDVTEQMKPIYQNVLVVYPQSLPRLFNAGCGSCIVSTLENFISIYDRLSAKFNLPEPDLAKPNKKRKKKDA